MIPSNTAENRLYGSVSCFTAQDLFYVDTDNISRAIIILRPNTWKLYIFMVPCLIFHPQVFHLSFFQKTALNLPFQSALLSSRVSFHVISWSIRMTDTVTHAVESPGLHRSWTPPVVGLCYLNPRSRVPHLPFSRVLAADPDECEAQADRCSENAHARQIWLLPFICDHMC